MSVKWRAEITKNNKKTSLGYHDTEMKAARVYDDAVRTHPLYNRSWLNFPDGTALHTTLATSSAALTLPHFLIYLQSPPITFSLLQFPSFTFSYLFELPRVTWSYVT